MLTPRRWWQRCTHSKATLDSAIRAIGVALVLLGLLWVLQGADLLHMQPILCFANCEPVVGGSTTWLIAGAIVMLAGIALIRRAIKRRRAA